MTKQVTITVTSPVECTDEQFQEWVEFCTGYCAEMSNDNPLVDYDMDANDVNVY